MDQGIARKLDAIKRKIDSGDFVAHAQSVPDWGGADVIISSRLNNDIKNWLADNPLIISLQETGPRRRAVITQFSKELSWLSYQLRDAYAGHMDYISKYDFFGSLAQVSIKCLKTNKDLAEPTDLLYTVLNEARRFNGR